jgi:pimeloyl-ACP methyl ester carboxylesterase
MQNVGSQSTPVRFGIRRAALILGALIIGLALAGAIYENISEARDRRFNPMPGRLVNVAGRKMHIYCVGSGSPTVILDAGLGDTYVSWREVQAPIGKFTRVCSYDRAGSGYSEPSSQPRTSRVIAEELHALLQAASIAPPYILAGHSMGGYNVRLYASLYPSDVAGVVFVDSSHPDQESLFPPELKNMEGSWKREAEFLAYTTPLGIPRLIGLCDQIPLQRAAECNWHSAREGMEELNRFSESAAQAGATPSFGDMPLAVLSHDPAKPSGDLPPDLSKATNDVWDKLQEEMVHLSTRGTRTIAKNSGHYIQIDRPDAVIDALRKMVEQIRPVPAA